jgi:oligoribonuclease NrnB/cAMP/cGMP phosphodiesterase (DHH superfamily)
MVTKIIYHQVKPGIDCPDGIWSAFVAKRKFPDAEVIGWCYSHSDNPVIPLTEKGDRLIIVDFSFPESVYKQWAEQGVETLTIDHHKTAWDELSTLHLKNNAITNLLNINKTKMRFDLNESGATLTWKYFYPWQAVPPILEYVRDRDLWNHQLHRTKEIHEAIASLRSQYRKQGRDVFKLFASLIELSREQLLAIFEPIGKDLLDEKFREILAIAGTHYMGTLDEYTIPYIELDCRSDRLVSDIGSHLNKTLQPLFVVVVTSDGQFHLRSDKDGSDFDVSAIAKKHGGGGHRNAAGFSNK